MKYIIAISLVSFGLIIAATEPKAPVLVPNSEAVTSSVDKGLAYLKQTQQPNGAWICKVGYKLNESYIGPENENVAVTALAGIAFMAQGNLPGRGKYGQEVSKAVDFVLSCSRDTDGYITKHGSRMYEHAFATLFLAEVYGMSPREDIKNKVKKAAYLIVSSQNAEGGWRYQPAPIDADISVTVTTVQALRAARNAGISVPKETIDNAINYIKKCSRQDGAFEYQLPSSRWQSLALSSAGVTSLMCAGEYDAPEVLRGINFIMDIVSKGRKHPYYPIYGDYHYFYAHYYTAQALHQAGGRYWDTYLPLLQKELLPKQLADGSWADDVGKTYATSMACIILQVENDYLPIIQR